MVFGDRSGRRPGAVLLSWRSIWGVDSPVEWRPADPVVDLVFTSTDSLFLPCFFTSSHWVCCYSLGGADLCSIELCVLVCLDWSFCFSLDFMFVSELYVWSDVYVCSCVLMFAVHRIITALRLCFCLCIEAQIPPKIEAFEGFALNQRPNIIIKTQL